MLFKCTIVQIVLFNFKFIYLNDFFSEIVKSKLSNQLQTARDKFTAIAEQQVAVSQLMAESLSTISKALEKIADNDKKKYQMKEKCWIYMEKSLKKFSYLNVTNLNYLCNV